MNSTRPLFVSCSIAVALAILVVGCGGGGGGAGGGSGTTTATTATTASAAIEAKSGTKTAGTAVFTVADGKVTVKVDVTDVAPGEHAVHIHDHPDCSSDDAMSAMGHWNPTMKDHGKFGTDPFHLGDIGNMTVGADGKGTISLTTELWTLDTAETNDVLDHAIMVHADPDDFKTQPTGNAGKRIGCGVIKLPAK